MSTGYMYVCVYVYTIYYLQILRIETLIASPHALEVLLCRQPFAFFNPSSYAQEITIYK